MMNNLTIPDLIDRRAELLKQLHGSIADFNESIVRNPNKLDPLKTVNLVENIQEANKVIENKKKEIQNKKYCHCLPKKGISCTSAILITINIVFWLTLMGFSIYNLATEDYNDPEINKNKNIEIASVVIALVGVLFTGVIAETVKAISQDKINLEIIGKISKLKDHGEENFKKFLKAIKEIQETESQEAQKRKLSNCVQYIDSMPEKGLKSEILSRNRLIEQLIQLLSEEHPIKRHYEKLKQTANNMLLQDNQPEGEDSEDATSEKMVRDKYYTMEYDPKIRKEFNESTIFINSGSSSEDINKSRKFSGEMTTFASAVQNPLFKNRTQIEPKHPFKIELLNFEKEAGFNLDSIPLGNYSIDREGRFIINSKDNVLDID